jgi:hypothetical protein
MPFASPAAPAEYFRRLQHRQSFDTPLNFRQRAYSKAAHNAPVQCKIPYKLDRIAIFLRGSERGGFRLVMQVLERVF